MNDVCESYDDDDAANFDHINNYEIERQYSLKKNKMKPLTTTMIRSL